MNILNDIVKSVVFARSFEVFLNSLEGAYRMTLYWQVWIRWVKRKEGFK